LYIAGGSRGTELRLSRAGGLGNFVWVVGPGTCCEVACGGLGKGTWSGGCCGGGRRSVLLSMTSGCVVGGRRLGQRYGQE
jgi:hypothetical protein